MAKIYIDLPATSSIAQIQSRLIEEYAKTTHISERITRHSIQEAIRMIRSKLKHYTIVNPGGCEIRVSVIASNKSITLKIPEKIILQEKYIFTY